MGTWFQHIPGGEATAWITSIITGLGALIRYGPKAWKGLATLLIANVRVMVLIRERDILRATVNTLLDEREEMLTWHSKSPHLGGPDSLAELPTRASGPTPIRSEHSNGSNG